MGIKLVCVRPMHGYVKGQIVTDPQEIEKLLKDRDHHFVKVSVEPAPSPPAPPAQPPAA